jgi:uncharacterized protein
VLDLLRAGRSGRCAHRRRPRPARPAHRPPARQVAAADDAGVDLQISGHTHGGQLWPFHYVVRLDQPTLHGLSRHGHRTQLYTSRGTGFWGAPLGIFAPSEVTPITLNSA